MAPLGPTGGSGDESLRLETLAAAVLPGGHSHRAHRPRSRTRSGVSHGKCQLRAERALPPPAGLPPPPLAAAATVPDLLAPALGPSHRLPQVLGNVHLVQTLNIMIVFLISGLVLRTQDIKKALAYWPGIAWGFLSILALTPCLGFALRELPLTPPEFSVGAQ